MGEKEFYKFSHLTESKALSNWVRRNKSFEEHGTLQYFYGMLCPVSVAEVKLTETTREDYDTIEMLILKLYSLGIKNASDISSLTGLKQEMTESILSLLKNGYKHIKNGSLTAEGKKSLSEKTNIRTFDTKRQIQYEAITGALINSEMEQFSDGTNAYVFLKKDKIYIKKFDPTEEVEKDVFAEISNSLGEIGVRNIDKVNELNMISMMHVEAFMVKYDFLPDPFIVMPKSGYTIDEMPFLPIAISQGNAEILKEKGLGFYRYEPPVYPDKTFSRLHDIEKQEQLLSLRSRASKTFEFVNQKKQKRTLYTVVDRNVKGARIRAHTDYPFLPFYCIKETEVPENVDV